MCGGLILGARLMHVSSCRSSVLLLLRVYALWSRRTKAFVILVGTYLVCYVVGGVFIAIEIYQTSGESLRPHSI